MRNAGSGRTQVGVKMVARSGEDYDGLDLLDETFATNYDAITGNIVEHCPVAHTAAGWLVSKYEDVREGLNQWEVFSSGAGGVNPWRPENFHFLKPNEVDPPLHGKFRRPFQRLFAPGSTALLEQPMRETARWLVAKIVERGTCEVATDYARPFVGITFFKHVLGLQQHDAVEFTELVHAFLNGPMEQQNAAAAEYVERCDDALRSYSVGSRTSEMLETILALEIDGQPASWDDKRAVLSLMIIGGLDTTVFSITSLLNHLCDDKASRRRIAQDRSLVPAAVEEGLRLFAPAWMLGRTAMRDVELRGRMIKAGEYVLLSFGLANKDPDVFENPLDFDLDRPAQKHIAFGAGPHRCIGSHLARLEIQVMLEEWFASIPEFRRHPGTKATYTTTLVRGVSELHIDVGG